MTESHVEKDISLSIEYAPDAFAPLRPETTGRWTVYSQDGKTMGVLWADDANEGVGFLAGDQDKLPGTGDFGVAMRNMTKIMKQAGVSAEMTYLALQQTPGATISEERTGPLSQAMEEAFSLTATPVTAAGEAPDRVGPGATIYAVFDPDSEDFIDILRSDTTGLYLWERGDWHRMPDEDDSFDNTEWIEISDKGLQYAQSQSDAGNTPTREEMLKYSSGN